MHCVLWVDVWRLLFHQFFDVSRDVQAEEADLSVAIQPPGVCLIVGHAGWRGAVDSVSDVGVGDEAPFCCEVGEAVDVEVLYPLIYRRGWDEDFESPTPPEGFS